jgi:formylglycine-generating enzyme required for sulfatase activity
MKRFSDTQLLLVFASILGLLVGCQQSVPKKINDGYGDYVLVPAGEFVMGNDSDEAYLPNEEPEHTVYLGDYYIGKYEMPNGEYKKFVDDGGYSNSVYWTAGGFGGYGSQPEYWDDADHQGGGIPENEQFPVVGVSLYEAQAYCNWLSATTGEKYRLPTEAEWEKAARGTDQRRYPWGDSIDGSYANYYKSGDPFEDDALPLGGFTPVGYYNGDTYGSFATHDNASPYGAYDMVGNVFEWVSDQYSESYYSNSPSSNPTGPSIGEYTPYGSTRAKTGDIGNIRGGFWTDNDRNTIMETLRSACRSPVPQGQGHRQHRTGFRCVREVSK